jgi:lactoylglutathione lyase
MKLGCTSVDAPDAAASLTFFENAFGWKRRFLHASGTDGALDTGATTPPFAAHDLAAPGDTTLEPDGAVPALSGRGAGGTVHADARLG